MRRDHTRASVHVLLCVRFLRNVLYARCEAAVFFFKCNIGYVSFRIAPSRVVYLVVSVQGLSVSLMLAARSTYQTSKQVLGQVTASYAPGPCSGLFIIQLPIHLLMLLPCPSPVQLMTEISGSVLVCGKQASGLTTQAELHPAELIRTDASSAPIQHGSDRSSARPGPEA